MSALKIIKKSTALLIFSSAVLLTACQSVPNNSLTFSYPQSNAVFSTLNQNVLINVVAQDLRLQNEVAQYSEKGQLIRLYAQPQLDQLFQQLMQQHLNAQGFRLINASQSNVQVTVNLQKFYADVQQGNLRYNIDSQIALDIYVNSAKGQFTKHFATTRSQEGAFSANNDEIHKVLSQTLNDIVQKIYQDQDVNQAIIQLTH